MKYTNTHIHIRALAMLLAFASVIIAPASAIAQNAASPQSTTAAGAPENANKTNQTTGQSDAQISMTLDQKMAQRTAWIDYYNQQSKKLYRYGNTTDSWQHVYETTAVPAIKKYGTDQEKETTAAMSKDIKKISKEAKSSWDKIGKTNDTLPPVADKLRNKPSEKTFEAAKKAMDNLASVFNTESEKIFKVGQTLGQYHQATTGILNRIIEELRKDPKTEAVASDLESGWMGRGAPFFTKISAPILVDPFELDPTKVTTQSPAGKSGVKKAGKQKQRQ